MIAESVRETPRWRLTLLALLFAAGFGGIAVQLIRYQLFRHGELLVTVEDLLWRKEQLPAKRGYIADVHGSLLALDLVQWDIEASPPLITRAEAPGLAEELAPLLGMPAETILEMLTSNAPWVQLKRGVAQEVGERVRELPALGLNCVPQSVRVYPEAELTAHVLGIVNATGEGFYGVEGYHNAKLKPVRGVRSVVRDPMGRVIPGTPQEEAPGRQGTSLVLTLDLNVQYIAAEELKKALEQFGAKSGTVLVMDPRTGAVLASVSYPSYDPNRFGEASEETLPDPAVSSLWEPGSVFKMITWGAGLDAGAITPASTYYDEGYLEVGGRTIRNWDNQGHGRVTVGVGLSKSLNVVAAYISTTLGKEQFYVYVRRFGFGSLTGVDLASEGPGMLRLPGDSNWFPSDLGANSFGQGLAVTPMQMITAASAIANGGLMMRPHIVQSYVVPDEGSGGTRIVQVEPQMVRRVISEEAAATLREMMVDAVEQVSTKALVEGYRIAGKSATAQIPIASGYHPTDTIASYIGFAPADDPQFVVLVKLDRPTSSPWGTQTAGPTFQAIAERLFVYMQIPPDGIRLAASVP